MDIKVKHLKTKTVIEVSREEYSDMINKLNKLNWICDNLTEMNDMYLSDVTKLYQIKNSLVDMLDANWDKDTYRYVKG